MSSRCEELNSNDKIRPYPRPFPDHCYMKYYIAEKTFQGERKTYTKESHQQHHKCPVFRVVSIHKF